MAAPGFAAGPPPVDGGAGQARTGMDATVMAYASWLSEMKQQAASAQYQQQAEFDLMRDAIRASSSELVDFKRHSTQVVQQLQMQVSEVRAKMSQVFSQIESESRKLVETEQRTGEALGGLREVFHSRHTDLDSGRRTLAERVDRLQSDVARLVKDSSLVQGRAHNLHSVLEGSQEQTVKKFSEVDQAMCMFHNSVNSLRHDLAETQQDWKKGQDLLGQAISSLSQDFADFQKHSSTVLNKLQSDVFHTEELGREDRERWNRVEAQLAGLQQNLHVTTGEVILLRSESERRGLKPSEGSLPVGPSLSTPARGGSAGQASYSVAQKPEYGLRGNAHAAPESEPGSAVRGGSGNAYQRQSSAAPALPASMQIGPGLRPPLADQLQPAPGWPPLTGSRPLLAVQQAPYPSRSGAAGAPLQYLVGNALSRSPSPRGLMSRSGTPGVPQ